MNDYLIDKNYIYQLGDGRGNYFIVPKTEMENGLSKPTKSQYQEIASKDGASRTNFTRKNFLGATESNLTFLADNTSIFSLGFIKKIFHQPPQRAFSFTRDVNGDVKMFFNPFVDVIGQPAPKESPNMEYGQATEKLSATLKYQIPYWFECKSGIAYFDYEAFSIYQVLYNTAGLQFDTGILYNTADFLATVTLSSLTLAQKQDYFTACKSTKALVYTDKFFDRTVTPSIESGQELINRTLTNNLVNDGQSTEIYKNTTADNHTYLIEITGVMATNEWVEIQNLTNLSSIRINWRATASSPSVMYYDSYAGKFYNAANAQIDPLNIWVSQTQPNFLYFSAMATANQTISSTTELIRVQKTSVNNLTIKIENLNTYEM
jgi:hypothetical protein